MPKKKPKPKEPARVEVLWKDAVHHCDNMEKDKEYVPSSLKSIGYLVKEHDNGDLVICNEYDLNDPNWARHISVIPNGMIDEWWEV